MMNPEIKTIEAQTIAYLSKTGSFSQIPEGYGQLYGWVAQQGLTPVGMPASVYLTPPAETPEEENSWELWAPVGGEPDEIDTDANGLGIKRVAAMTVASVMHKGPYDTVESTYERLWAWVAESGYQIVGWPMEIYYSDPNEVPPEETLTEIQLPVARM